MSTRSLLFLTAFGGVFAAGLLAAHGRADTDDVVFLDAVHGGGVYSSFGDYALIAAGRQVCVSFSQGYSFGDVVAMIDAGNPHIPVGGAGTVIGAAAASYCPRFEGKFIPVGGSTIA